MSFDPRCYDLATLFLADEPTINTEPKRNELAQLIQTTIEDWIEYADHKKGVSAEPNRPTTRQP